MKDCFEEELFGQEPKLDSQDKENNLESAVHNLNDSKVHGQDSDQQEREDPKTPPPRSDHSQQQTPQQLRPPTETQGKQLVQTSYNIVIVLLMCNWGLVFAFILSLYTGNEWTRPVWNRISIFLHCFSVHGVYLLWVLEVEPVREEAIKMFSKLKSAFESH